MAAFSAIASGRRGVGLRGVDLRGVDLRGVSALAGVALFVAALALGGPAAAESVRLPNWFEANPVGAATLYETDRGRRLYVYAERTAEGHVEKVFDGCPASGDPADLGAPLARHVYEPGGELLRSEWAGGYKVVYAPHGCAITLGACAGEAEYVGWLPDKTAVERYRFESRATREGDRVRFVYVERDLGGDAVAARIEGWFDILPGGGYRDGESTEERRGEATVARWYKFLAGPAPIPLICGPAA